MSRTKKILHQQTVADVAIAWQGSIEAVYDIAVLNGIAITDELIPGADIIVGSLIYDADVANYYANKNIQPATGFVFVPDGQFEPVNVLVGGELQGTYNSGDVADLNLIDGEGNPILDFTISGNDIIVPMAGPVEIPDVIFYDDFFWRSNFGTNTQNIQTEWIHLYVLSTGNNINQTGDLRAFEDWSALTEPNRIGIKNIYHIGTSVREYGIYRQANGINTNSRLKLTFEIKVIEELSNGSQGIFHWGYLNDQTAAVANDNDIIFNNSAYLEVNYHQNTLRFITSNGGVSTISNLNIALINIGYWQTIEIDVEPGESILIIDGVEIVTHPDNIPAVTGVGFKCKRFSGASTVRGFLIDTVKLERI